MKVSVVFSKKNKTDLKGYLFLTYVKRDRGIVEKKKISLDYSLQKDQFDKYFNKSFNQFIPNKIGFVNGLKSGKNGNRRIYLEHWPAI